MATAEGLKVVDITDPESPIIVGSIDTSAASNVHVSGNYAYVVGNDGAATLRVIKVTLPHSPEITSFTVEPTEGAAPLEVQFKWSVSDPDGDNLICEFDFDGDGNTDKTINDCASGTESFTYNSEGSYTAKLTVSDGLNSVSQVVEINISQTITFADPNLEACVRGSLGIDENTPITKDMVKNLTELNCYDVGITSLAGIENLTNLQELSLTWNQISDISPLAKLTNLQELDLCDNPIQDFSPISNLNIPYCYCCGE